MLVHMAGGEGGREGEGGRVAGLRVSERVHERWRGQEQDGPAARTVLLGSVSVRQWPF